MREFDCSNCTDKFNYAMRRKIILALLLMGALLYLRAYCKLADLTYTYAPQISANSMKDYAARRSNFSRAIGVADFSTEKYTERDSTHNGYGIIFIHGFGATRAEGEATVEVLAESLNANTYYVRLPGHATGAEAHAAATFDEYLQVAEEALMHSRLMGKKIILMGASTGALVATYLAIKYPDKIHALIAASPLWDFGSKITRLLNFPGGLWLGELFMGKTRDAGWKSDPEKRVHPDYAKHWLTKQKTSALVNLNNLRRYVVNPTEIRAIKVPTLALFYEQDSTHRDSVIDVDKIRQWLPTNGKSKAVAIADGSHILLSRYVRSDKKRILATMQEWLEAL